MADELIRDAIADARAVRETALANAKAALEEAFTPQLTSMLSARLRNEIEGDMDDDLEEINDPVNADGHGGDEGGETDVEAVEKSSFTEAAVDVGDGPQSDSEKQLDSSDIATPEDNTYGTSTVVEPDADARTSSDVENDDRLGMNENDFMGDDDYLDGDDVVPEMDDFGDDEFGGEEERDLDLEAIIRELEADITDDEFGGDDLDMGMDAEMPVDDEEEMVPEALDLKTPNVSDGHGTDEGGEEDKAAIEKSTFTEELDFEDDGEEIDLEEILREMEAEDEEEVKIASENAALRNELKEYRTAVKFLRSKLNEVNLLNAKLLYTNKLFKKYNMNNRQKMRVVENFDRATTIRETKLVYSTLAETFNGKPVSKKARGSIAEGIASRQTGSTRPKAQPRADGSEKTVLSEGFVQKARMQKLAGIKSN